MAEHDLGPVGEWRLGDRRKVDIGRRSICVVRTEKGYYALNDACPHYGASLSLGTVSGTMVPSAPQTYDYGMENCVLRCPWHGWEFDLETGRALFDPNGMKARTYSVKVVDDRVVLEV